MTGASRPAARISRRALLRRGGALAIGATGLALVGCGDDSDSPADAPAAPVAEDAPEDQATATATPEPAPVEQAEPGDVPAEAEAADESQAAAAQAEAEPDDAAEAPAEEAPEEAPEEAEAQAVAEVEEPAEEPPAPIIPDPARRMLMPDRVCADCTLEDPAFEPLPHTRVFFGYADGAAYRVEIPNEWDGTLFLWGRGFGGLNDAGTGFSTHIGFGGLPPGRELVTSLGAGWAASTYAATGYAPARGVDDLLTAKEIAEAEVGPAQSTYCVGASMGGGTAQLMAQEFPEEIDGALALCGSLSNAEVADYLAGWHAVAHWLIGEEPSSTDAMGLIGWATALGSVDDAGLHLTPLGEQFAAVIEDLSGGPRWGFREGLAQQWQINFALGTLYVPELVAQAPCPPGPCCATTARSSPSTRRTWSTARARRRGSTSTG